MIECPGCLAELAEETVVCPHCQWNLTLTPIQPEPHPPENLGTSPPDVPLDIDPPDWRPPAQR